MAVSQSRKPEANLAAQATVLEYVTIPGCADCRRFEELVEHVIPDFPGVEVREVAAETPRGMAISVERGMLRFPVIVLDDEVIAVESIGEAALRSTLAARRDNR